MAGEDKKALAALIVGGENPADGDAPPALTEPEVDPAQEGKRVSAMEFMEAMKSGDADAAVAALQSFVEQVL